MDRVGHVGHVGQRWARGGPDAVQTRSQKGRPLEKPGRGASARYFFWLVGVGSARLSGGGMAAGVAGTEFT